MIREVLRILGVGCILASGILYFTNDGSAISDTQVIKLQDELVNLKSDLAKTKEELAIAQTTSSTEAKVPRMDQKEVESLTEPLLTIEPGSNSTVVSASLEKLGIIKNAAEFDAYLADHALAGKIQIGEYKVDTSMDFESIAKTITTGK
ncbi:hypothetical protein [Sporosarcina sp. NPDC096371]|uniref:hypothetical protein n=1 Tax=Sporosarcina sp. NPDC096371 TaxID=3364530 RepID=UPI0037F3B957